MQKNGTKEIAHSVSMYYPGFHIIMCILYTLAYISSQVDFSSMLNEYLCNWNMIFLGGIIQRGGTLLGRRGQHRSHTDHE